MRNIITLTLLFSYIIALMSCAPQSKETYLQDYKTFIKDVSNNYKDYTTEDWKKADEKYKKYSEDWKMKFTDEFTILEKGILLGNEMEYNVYRIKQPLLNLLDNYVSDDYEKIKQQIIEYQDKNMQDDIDELVKKAEVIGGEVQQTIQQILKELDSKTKE